MLQDEWCLIFNYIMSLPMLLDMCVDVKKDYCDFRPHLICIYLCSMVRVFSQYYRRVRILLVSYMNKYIVICIHKMFEDLILNLFVIAKASCFAL